MLNFNRTLPVFSPIEKTEKVKLVLKEDVYESLQKEAKRRNCKLKKLIKNILKDIMSDVVSLSEAADLIENPDKRKSKRCLVVDNDYVIAAIKFF